MDNELDVLNQKDILLNIFNTVYHYCGQRGLFACNGHNTCCVEGIKQCDKENCPILIDIGQDALSLTAIAAAPDLLNAAESLLPYVKSTVPLICTCGHCVDCDKIHNAIAEGEAAIAAARGSD